MRLNCAECVLGPPSSRCCYTLSPNNSVDKGKRLIFLFYFIFSDQSFKPFFHFVFINNVKSFSWQIIANHHMQSISFASGGDPVSIHNHYDLNSMFSIWRCLLSSYRVFCYVFKDTTDYVAYVAKDPVNRRGIQPSCNCRLSLFHLVWTATCSSQRALLIPSSLPHPGVLWWPGPGRHQHDRPGLRPALPAVLAVSLQQDLLLTWQVTHTCSSQSWCILHAGSFPL